MRVVFFILLLANVAVLAYFLLQPQRGGMAARPALRPEAIRIANPAPVELQCLEWRGMSGEAIARARGALEEVGLGAQVTAVEETEHLVHIPSLASRAEAEKKLGELKAMGIEGASVVGEEESSRFAVSLGVFPTRQAAEAELARLTEKGVKSARLAQRQVTRGLLVTGVDDEGLGRLRKIAAGFAGSELNPVPCPKP